MKARLEDYFPDTPKPQTAKFRVKVKHESGLKGMIELITSTSSSAKRRALTSFFRDKGWEVTSCKKVKWKE